MLVQIRDRAALSSLPSTNLRHYLKTHGWKDAGQWGKRATIHQKKYGRRNWEILIPLSDTVADYAERMAESIAILATAEDRSQLDVFYDVLEAGSGEAQELVKTINGQKKQAKEAVQKVRQNLAAFPLDRAISEADSLQRDGKIEEAIEKWRSIANIAEGINDDLAAHAWFSIGFLLQQRDMENVEAHIQEVLFAYDQVIRLNPDDARAYNNRGIVKRALDLHEAALADYDQAIRLKPYDAAAYNNRGIVKSTLSRYEDAINDYDQAIHLKRDDAEAYYNRGNAKSIIGQHKAAITDYDRAIHLNPDYAEAYYNRGDVKSDLGQYKAAITDYDRAIALNPSYVSAYNNRGIVKGALGQHKAAIADYDQAIRLNPNLAQAYNNRGIEKSSLGRHEDAITDFDRAIHLKPDSATYNNRGTVKNNLGGLDAAIADYDLAIGLNPDYVEAYCNRGTAKGNLGDHDAAIADYDLAIGLNPDYVEAYCNRGTANAILDRMEEARADFEAALDLANRSGNTYLKLRIERQLQVIKDTVSTSDSVRKTKDWRSSSSVYESAGQPLFSFDSPTVTRLPSPRALAA